MEEAGSGGTPLVTIRAAAPVPRTALVANLIGGAPSTLSESNTSRQSTEGASRSGLGDLVGCGSRARPVSTNRSHALSRTSAVRPVAECSDVMSASGAPLVPMVHATNLRNRSHVAHSRRLHRTRRRCVLGQREMHARPVIVVDKTRKVSVQAVLVEYDHLIQAFAANRTDDSLDVRRIRL